MDVLFHSQIAAMDLQSVANFFYLSYWEKLKLRKRKIFPLELSKEECFAIIQLQRICNPLPVRYVLGYCDIARILKSALAEPRAKRNLSVAKSALADSKGIHFSFKASTDLQSVANLL